MHAAAVALLQWQDTKLHARGGCCSAAVAGYQTACARGCPVSTHFLVDRRGYSPAAVLGSQTALLNKGRANI
jgi:hypothetical protein